jgi:hypothetical protein
VGRGCRQHGLRYHQRGPRRRRHASPPCARPNNFAPRFSFAYDLTGKANTAIRGGYGLFYSREILGAFILMSGNPPFSQLVTLLNGLIFLLAFWMAATGAPARARRRFDADFDRTLAAGAVRLGKPQAGEAPGWGSPQAGEARRFSGYSC